MAENTKLQAFLDKFAAVSAKVGNQVHLRSLRDAFATITPLYILAGIAVLVNNVLFGYLWSDTGFFPNPELLANVQTWGNALTLGTLNVSALILAGLIGYCLATNKRFENPLACVVVGISAFVVMMPQSITATLAATSPLLTDEVTTAQVTGALSTTNTGTNGLFGAIIIGLLAVTLFIKISGVEKLKVNLGEGVPPAVGNSFNVMIPMLLTLSIFGLVAALLAVFASTDLPTIISTFIATPLKSIMNAGPWAFIVIYTLANLLFCVGIHQSTISGATVEPILPGLFNINEPVIYGYPIVFNLPLMIPFVIIPDLFIGLTYGLTCAGWLSPCIAQAPWTTPPILSALLSTGFDWRAAVWQVLEIVIGMAIYLPFMKISERAQALQGSEAAGELAE
ncbi:PTS sugar transporter subunit IIC [Olsenella uli]|uniref:PTS sugar transporter subunit IIC n=1 Tax=Olsenella uli TaxID=133926 RepID=UPI001956403E|nr:PTS transporter subunit EIIC [Olsenella uli]MBM6675954.1 PTS sugar transporter subunit IIC [Olsenella uli]